VVSRQDVGNIRWGHYYAVMQLMSKDSKRLWTHRMDRTLWRNLRLSLLFYLWTCVKWDNIGLTLSWLGKTAKSLFIFLFLFFSFLFFSYWTYNYKMEHGKVSSDFVTMSQLVWWMVRSQSQSQCVTWLE